MGGFLRPVVKREVTTRLLQVVLEFGPEVAGIAGEELRPSPSRAVYILKTALFTRASLALPDDKEWSEKHANQLSWPNLRDKSEIVH